MGTTNKHLDSTVQRDGDPDTYAVQDVRREEDTMVGTVPADVLEELLESYPEACRVFDVREHVGYGHPSDRGPSYTTKEHAGRVESDLETLRADLTDDYTGRVRLDTTDPQLVKVSNGISRAQIELDDSIVRFVPP